MNSFMSRSAHRVISWKAQFRNPQLNQHRQRQYNKASFKAIIYENLIPAPAARNAKEKCSIIKAFNKFKMHLRERKIMQNF